jgi:hypothetical protein
MDAKRIEDLVKDWYTKTARGEWRRLMGDSYRQIEFIVTMHFLKKYRAREKWNMWLEILLQTCTHPTVVGGSEHFLLVGRRVR